MGPSDRARLEPVKDAIRKGDPDVVIDPVAAIETFGDYSKALASLTHIARLEKGYVEAIAIDYAESAHFTLRAASMAGGDHRRQRRVRQDSFAVAEPAEDILVVAVADGVGSLPYSHFAATWACQAACKLLSDALILHPHLHTLRPEVVLSPINDGLVALQTSLAVEFATTLVIGAIVCRNAEQTLGWFARVGDSTAATLSQTADEKPQWRFLFGEKTDAQDGIATTRTSALPHHAQGFEHLLIPIPRGRAVFLLTDGVHIPLELSPSVREGLGRRWLSPPLPLDFASHVSFNRRGEFDDRTVVGIWLRP
jgi:hypothetical protein